MIKIDYTKKEVVIEFSGKILGDRYPELISINNIGQCFRNIEKLGFCKFDMDLIMKAEVVSCDVTKDIPCGDIQDSDLHQVPYLKLQQVSVQGIEEWQPDIGKKCNNEENEEANDSI